MKTASRTAHGIVADLEQHFLNRIKNNLYDFAARLLEAGESVEATDARVISNLVILTAKVVAHVTEAPPQQVGNMFAAIIADTRAGDEPTQLEEIVGGIMPGSHRRPSRN